MNNKPLKVLFVCSGNSEGFTLEHRQAFIYDQMNHLVKMGIEVDLFIIKGKGISGYLSNLKLLKEQLKSGGHDLVHAFYGTSGLLAVLQRKVPVIISFLGSDINNFRERLLSRVAMTLSAHNIFVAKHLARKALAVRNFTILPFGVDLDMFHPMDKQECLKAMELDPSKRYALFASSPDNPVKNFKLAHDILEELGNVEVLCLLKNIPREKITMLLNASDFLIMTSFNEGSPQVIKEAMACNTPIASTPVGDVKEILKDIKGCTLIGYNSSEAAKVIFQRIPPGFKTHGRERIRQFDICLITGKLIGIYQQ